jgi:hypothetical protein
MKITHEALETSVLIIWMIQIASNFTIEIDHLKRVKCHLKEGNVNACWKSIPSSEPSYYPTIRHKVQDPHASELL